MTESMIKLIEEMKALELQLGAVENIDSHINPYLQSAYTLAQVKGITDDLYCFKNTTDLYEVGSHTNEIKHA